VIAKKKTQHLDKTKRDFLAGCRRNGIEDSVAEQVFSQMQEFAQYAFNKSHAACYGLLAYQMAYLKVHHPAEFITAKLQHDADDQKKVAKLVAEGRRKGIAFLSPDINESAPEFTLEQGTMGHAIRFGLGAVTGFGAAASEAIHDARERGAFTSVRNFLRRVERKHCNRKVVGHLIMAGAFDSLLRDLKLSRGGMLQQIKTCKDLRALEPQSDGWDGTLAEIDFRTEMMMLGCHANHPLVEHAEWLSSLPRFDCADMRRVSPGMRVSLVGIASFFAIRLSKRGTRYGRFTVEDLTGKVTVQVFGLEFRANETWLHQYAEDHALVQVEAIVQRPRGAVSGSLLNLKQVIHLRPTVTIGGTP
jgi:DNA polymerase-3 subunit alpha